MNPTVCTARFSSLGPIVFERASKLAYCSLLVDPLTNNDPLLLITFIMLNNNIVETQYCG